MIDDEDQVDPNQVQVSFPKQSSNRIIQVRQKVGTQAKVDDIQSEYSQSYQEENIDDEDVNDSDYQNEGGEGESRDVINWNGRRQEGQD